MLSAQSSKEFILETVAEASVFCLPVFVMFLGNISLVKLQSCDLTLWMCKMSQVGGEGPLMG